MREIKFRGRDEEGQWHYGFLSWCTNVLAYICVGAKYEVDPDTVGQFTGLCDANGREIYEGDIVRFKEAYKGVLNEERVREVVGVVSYVYCEFKIVSDGTFELWAPCLMEGVTVVGNVHDNPDLLEVAHD